MKKLEASYTVEAAFVISGLCILIGSVLMLAFFVHDYCVLVSIADEAALYGSLCEGRKLIPEQGMVDFEALISHKAVPAQEACAIEYERMKNQLLCVTVDEFSMKSTGIDKHVQVAIQAHYFILGKKLNVHISADMPVITSKDIPRRPGVKGGGKNEY